MSINNLDDVLTALQSVEDQSKLLKHLIDIRKVVDWPKHKDNITKLREKGLLKKIISSLQTSKKGIIDVCLSILGNCCLDHKCARDAVGQFNILPGLNQILKRYPKEDSINGRVFRIVGNICQHRDQWANVIIDKKPQIIIHTVSFLKNAAEKDDDPSVSDATITMGVRCLREMLNIETLKDLVKTYGVLKAVGMLLIKNGILWQEKKRGENVLINIIKLLLEYSRYRFYPSIQEMRTTDKGDSIVYLSKILLVAPKEVVKIVMNFLRISQLKSDLPVPEIFDSFIEILRDESITKEFNGTCEECIKCLCRLLEHPGNRKNDRCGDSIPILINVLKDLNLDTNNKIECCILIISTLNKCKYNQNLITDQLRYNIISVLKDKLKLIVGSVEPLNIAHKSDKKRRNDFMKAFRKSKRYRLRFDDDVGPTLEDLEESESSDDDEIEYFYNNATRFDYSPTSSDSGIAMSWSSGLSPQSSPRSQICGMSETDSDDYSPVCSEVDASDFPMSAADGADSLDRDLDKKSEEVEEIDELPSYECDSGSAKKINIKLVMEIVELLKTYIRLKPPAVQLGNPELLLGLIKSSGYFEWPHSSAITDIADAIYRILEMHDFLLPLMQSNFIPSVYDLSKMQHGSWCAKCRQFQWIGGSVIKTISKVAESEAGKGDIAHKLLRGDSATKQQLVLVIPYIVRNKAILMKLMLNCGGLEILMKLLQEESEQQEKSIKVLCVLASKKLGIPNPRHIKSSTKTGLTECGNVEASEIVTFILDDGTSLTADRNLLSRNSDYFRSLLNGGFKESTEDMIKLPNVAHKSLRCLLHLIKCDIGKSGPVDIDLDLHTHLDVIGLCDRFLMQEYCLYLTDCVEKFRLSSDTIPMIYNWSLESRTNLLRIECIAFALVANIIDSERFEMFKNLFDLGYNDELVEDIRKLLVRYLTLSQFCECSKKKDGSCDNKCKNLY